MEVELGKSEVPALAELKDLCRHECTAERYADTVREFGWSLEYVLEDMKTPEMCRRALEASAELGYGHLALLHHIPFAEVCMEAIRDWYGEGRADLYEVASAIRPEVFDGKMADFLVAEDGRYLSLLLVHLQTPELWRRCAEHNWMSFVMIPWRERLLEACLTAYLNYPGMIHAHPHVVPQPVDSYCNVYSLCRLMEQMKRERDAAVSDLTFVVNQYRLETTGIDLCGLCEYDLPPVGENGQTAECPGFYVNDCFKWRGPEEG